MSKESPLVNVQIRADHEVSVLFDRTMEEHEIKTRGKFLELLLERFLNPKTEHVNVSMPEDVQSIADLNARIVEMEANALADTDQVRSNYAEYERQVTEMQHRIFAAESELTILRDKKPENDDPDAVKVKLNAAMAELVDKCVNRASSRTGKAFTRSDIFQNLFWEALSSGRASLPIIFSSSEIASVLQKHKPTETPQ